MSGPYAYAAADYWNAGWRGVLPLPAGQKAPQTIAEKAEFTGYTGYAGRDPSYPDVMAWIEDRGTGNVALHLPPGVLGLDIDDYTAPDGKIKRGGDTLKRCEANWGTLPPTWRTTSRDNVSGIRLFRVPVTGTDRHLRWPGSFGPGTETIHAGHRYVVAPPSVHPDTGNAYRWIAADGSISSDPPRLADLPELPWAWVVGLTEGREAHTHQGAGMNDDEIRAWLEAHNTGQHMCPPMREVSDHIAELIDDGAHESLSHLMRIVSLAGRGHEGLFKALHRARFQFVDTAGRRRDGGKREAEQEWRRSLFGAVDKIVGSEELPDSPLDPCEFGTLEVAPAEPPTAVDNAVDEVIDAEIVDEPSGEPAPEPRELTDEEQAELAAARRENDIVKKAAELDIVEEARRRLAARNAPPLELLDADEFLDSPTPEPLILNMLYKDSLTRIFGAPGCGKSFLSLDLAFHAATGRAWMGHDVEQTKVIYVMAEGQRVNTARARAWLERHGVDRDALRGWFYAVPHKVLLTEDAIKDLVTKVRELKAGLVFFDTKNAMMLGDENSASDFAVVRRSMDLVREASDAAVVLIDHTGFSDGKRARGSSAGVGAMDTEVLVENDGGKPAKVTTTTTRDKGDEDGTTYEFFLRAHPLEDGTPAAVLLPVGEDIELPAPRSLPGEIERKWQAADLFLPPAVVDYEGPGQAAVTDLAKFMAHDAGVADPDGIGVTRVQAATALSVQKLGKATGHSDPAVRRAWSALRRLGYIAPADGRDGSDGRAENTTGRHVWTAPRQPLR